MMTIRCNLLQYLEMKAAGDAKAAAAFEFLA
jgi:hypothetical protein